MRDLGSGEHYGKMQKMTVEMGRTHREKTEQLYGKRVINMELPGRRRGRPKRRWSNNMDEDLENIGAMRQSTLD